jgi:predicted phosphodiesterase
MLTIISDVHGKRQEYLDIIDNCNSEYTLQIGDLDFNYEFLGLIEHDKHRVIPGNHDNHLDKYKYPHFLLNYGLVEHGGIKFFYLEGGFSIDKSIRVERELLGVWPKTWWDTEELTQEILEDALRVYKEVSPDILISHEASRAIANKIGNSATLSSYGYDIDTFTTRTSDTLQRMINAHAPKLHIFGHYHMNYDEIVNGTRYICQKELDYLDLDTDLSIRKYSYTTGEEYI